MVLDNCHLCGQRDTLIDSHIWPRFAYKRYASDLTKGGSFLDLRAMRTSNSQYTRPWFCKECDTVALGRMEAYASEFCSGLEKRPTAAHDYDERLLQFAASISWRTAKYYLEDATQPLAQETRLACRQWKDYLRGKRSGMGPFTQHLFIVFDPVIGLHRALGGEVFPDQRLVLSQIGPLIIVGLLSRKGLPLSELKVWEQSELRSAGGTVTPLTVWRVGKNVTLDLTRLLARHEVRTKRRILEIGQKRRVSGSSRSHGKA